LYLIARYPMLLPPFNFPENIVLFITDTLPSPASFLLHKALSSHLKSSSTTTPKSAVIVSISEDLWKWKAISSRSVRLHSPKFILLCTLTLTSQNLNLSQHIDSGSVIFIEALSLSQPPDPSDSSYQPSLRPLFDSILSALSSRGPSPQVSERLVILDDISTLEWIGFSFLDVCRFVRALVATCRHVSRQ